VFDKRAEPFLFELHGPLGNVRRAFFEIDLYSFLERLTCEFTPGLRSVLALLDFGNAILFELLRLPFIGCVQRLAITNAVDRYIEVASDQCACRSCCSFPGGIFPSALTISLAHGWS
jgi:hypothetical protein